MSVADGFLKFIAKIDTDEFNNGLNKLSSTAAKGMASLGTAVAGAATAAVTAGVAALGKITVEAAQSAAEAEQLLGGTKLLYGDAYDYVVEKAENAYSEIQMSANDYLTQVNGLSTGLKTALDGDAKAAAELADKVVTAEADIVAATGASQENVQNAFNGIMKSNYTMLDNLNLGIDPTKEGFQELIDKVNDWSAAHGEATDYQIDNLADAQAALVKYVEIQGMAGYAQDEGMKTLSGSIASMKGAWDNFLNGAGDANALVETVSAVAVNLVKTLGDIVPRLAEGIPELMSSLSTQLPTYFNQLLPAIIDGAASLISGLAAMLPGLVTAILPSLVTGVVEVIAALAAQLPDLLVALGEALLLSLDTIFAMLQEIDFATVMQDICTAIIGFFNSDGLTQFITLGLNIITWLIQGIAEAIPVLVENLPMIMLTICSTIISLLPELLVSVGQILLAVLQAIISFIPSLISGIGQVLSMIISTIGEWIGTLVDKAQEAGSNFCENLVDFISSLPENIAYWLGYVIGRVIAWSITFVKNAREAGSNFLNNIINFVKNLPENLATWLTNTITKVTSFVSDMGSKGTEAIKKLGDNIIEGAKSLPETVADIGKNIVEGVWQGIQDAAGWFASQVTGFFSGIVDGVKEGLGIHSPSKVFRDEIGKWLLPGVTDGIEDSLPSAEVKMSYAANSLVDSMKASVASMQGSFAGTVARSGFRLATAGGGSIDNSFVQYNTYQVPVASPSSVAASQRSAARKLYGGVQ